MYDFAGMGMLLNILDGVPPKWYLPF